MKSPLDFLSILNGFGSGDQIDLLGQKASSLSFFNDTLTVVGQAGAIAHLAFTGSYSQTDFTLSSDGHGGSLITFV